MRDPKLPPDEYNKRLHIYAETPGLQLPLMVPASEKELNVPPTSPVNSAAGGQQTNPYARIPAANFVEEEEEEEESGVAPPTSNAVAGASSSSSSSSQAVIGTQGSKPRDPIYAELAHTNSEDERVERIGSHDSQDTRTVPGSSGDASNTTPNSRIGNHENVSTHVSSRGDNARRKHVNRPTSPLTAASSLPSPGIRPTQGRAEQHTKTIRTHTRLDASLEIPSTPRPKLPGSSNNEDGGGVTLIKKVDLNPENDGDEDEVDTAGITLKHVKTLEDTASGPQGAANDEDRAPMPTDPDLDAGTALLKKKRRFRRNMIIIISFLMVLLIVVAAVIISLVIVTKG
ncbi:uncharacterized protein [Diadema setosum]|uniref:uncharacterized protein n=1 Tax=Diadema setosum TaxID=31175 RepID=UPI003B3B2AFA